MQFLAPQNQQNPSDHDRLMSSNPNRHNFQTIPKSCTANFRIMPEVKKRYIIRAYTQGSDLTVPESAETAWRSRETTWPKQFSEISDNSYFLWGGFSCPNYPAEEVPYARPVQIVRKSALLFLRKPAGTFQLFPTFFQRFQRFERIERIGANAKTQLLGENATFGRKYNLLRKTADSQH